MVPRHVAPRSHREQLEDKVSALESKNDTTTGENQNLRDLLSRLQNENMMLKQQQFTFQMSKNAPGQAAPTLPAGGQTNDKSPSAGSSSSASSPASTSSLSSSSAATSFGNSPMFTMNPGPSPLTTPTPPFSTEAMAGMDPLEYSSYANLDPNAFNLFDDFGFPQETASSKSMDLDFGFNGSGNDNPHEFINVASNPIFASMPSLFDVHPTEQSQPQSQPVSQPAISHDPNMNVLPDFDLNSLSSWPLPTTTQAALSGTLDDLFGYPPNPSQPDFSAFMDQSNISPVVHSTIPSAVQSGGTNGSSPSSPSSHGSGPSLFSATSNHASPASDTSEPHVPGDECPKKCPKTREEMEQATSRAGASMFAPSPPTSSFSPTIGSGLQQKQAGSPFPGADKLESAMVGCSGTSFPTTDKSEKNIEVLAAWKSIRSDPRYKVSSSSCPRLISSAHPLLIQDTDINELCSQFSDKARCDGTKVVLEPSGVDQIKEKLNMRSLF